MAKKPKLHGHNKGGSRGYSDRSTGRMSPGKRFLIVCEGEKTEPNYFSNYSVPGLIDVHAEGYGVSPPQLVDMALKLKRNSSRQRDQDEFDQVWCVFDKDDWDGGEFNNSIKRAEGHGLKVAYSNQAFELWYLLHFYYYDTRMHRRRYVDRLSELLGHPYDKSASYMYERLYDRQETAIRNAERLLRQYSPPNPGADDPSTTVHQLVQALNRFLPGKR